MKTRKTKGAGFSNSKRRVNASRRACEYTYLIDGNTIYDKEIKGNANCDTFVHKYDVQLFPDKKVPGKRRLEFNEFFKSPLFKSNVTYRITRDGIDYFYNGNSLKKERAKWYEEIGSRILWYNDPKIKPTIYNKNPGYYVLRDKPLTIEEVRMNTNEKLNNMLSTLPPITDETVNNWYRKGQKLYNPDYKSPVVPLTPVV